MYQPLRAVVFDLDGTIIDTAPDLHACLAGMLVELDRPAPPLEEIRPMIGDGARALLARNLEATGGLPPGIDLDGLYAAFLERYTADPIRLGGPFEGLVSLLEELRAADLRLGLCTNKPQVPTLRILDQLDLRQHFDSVIGGDVLSVRKPDPGHIHAVLDELGVGPAEAVMIGDSENDVLAATAAGLPALVVSFGYTQILPAELGGEAVIDRLAELPQALRALAARSLDRRSARRL